MIKELIDNERKKVMEQIKHLEKRMSEQSCPEIINTRVDIEWWKGFCSALNWIEEQMKDEKRQNPENEKI